MTIVEVLIVILIIGILGTLSYRRFRDHATDRARVKIVSDIAKLLKTYHAENLRYPSTVSNSPPAPPPAVACATTNPNCMAGLAAGHFPTLELPGRRYDKVGMADVVRYFQYTEGSVLQVYTNCTIDNPNVFAAGGWCNGSPESAWGCVYCLCFDRCP